MSSFTLLNTVRDAIGLIRALGYSEVFSVVGHDYGASVAAWCALVRPDIFKRCALMSAPFDGPPKSPAVSRAEVVTQDMTDDIHSEMAKLSRPRETLSLVLFNPSCK